MNLNGLFKFIHEFSYKTFEIIPIIGEATNLFFMLAGAGLFLYWLKVLASSSKQG